MGGRRDLVIDEMAQAVMGTERLGGGAVQSWAMPEDDPHKKILDRFRELFERGTADRGAVQGLQLGGIGDQLDFFAQALRFKK